ncbi:AAA family ATPase [Tannockella kyphosi]|uniref:AAA family ATPase n=1 Tax=Tannockella kyphosi TaxID=2899121 RepID=UPI0020123918|nr:ATP-binding protein [Tannockella kyphosi]
MLVQFIVRNYLSFKEEAILDMCAISSYKEHEYNLIDVGMKENFLKVATIYGANASGKSNLLFAMNAFHQIIKESLNNSDNDEIIIKKLYNPFKFANEKDNTEFQVIQILDDFEFNYGFEYNDEEIVSEWLYIKNIATNRTKMIFERERSKITFGASVKKECDIYKEQLPKETLVLSWFNKLRLKTKVFDDVYEAILNTTVITSDAYESPSFLNNFLKPIIDKEKEKLLSFLVAIDSGIKDIFYMEKDGELEYYTGHIGSNGEKYTLNLFHESQGTLKSISIFIHSCLAIKTGLAIVVDEMNAKLHPLLLKFIVDLFNNQQNKQAQLIYTTHDTTLLDKRFFRRDQIWFVEKDEFGYSKLIALSNFKVRNDASFEKDYLSGVYGGIPFIKDFDLKVAE